MNSPANNSSTSITLSISVQTYGSKPVKEFGFVWGENGDPTVDTNKFIYTGNDKPGKFSGTISSLKAGTLYYFRAYLVTEDGNVFYSSQVSLKTLLHQITSLAPASASPDMEVTVNGLNFEPGVTALYFNETKIDAQVTNNTIKFVVPFGLQTDSVSIAVEMAGVKAVAPKKLHYKKGRWVMKVQGEFSSTLSFPIYLSASGRGYVMRLGGPTILEYSPLSNSWSQIADFPEEIWNTNWFCVGRQIFAQTDFRDKFFMYDLDTKQWNSSLTTLPIPNWYPSDGIAFTIKHTGYMGLSVKDVSGKYVSIKEIWKYQPSQTWVRLNDFPGKGTSGALDLTIDESVYVIGGSDHDTGELSSEMWKYDPSNDTWEKRANYPGNGKVYLTGFVINNKLYAGTGLSGNKSNPHLADATNDFWEYDPTTNKWSAVANFPEVRYHSYSFTLENQGYTGGGVWFLCSDCGMVFRNDLWKFELQ